MSRSRFGSACALALGVLVVASAAGQERRVPPEADHELTRFLGDVERAHSLRARCQAIQERIATHGDRLASLDGRTYVPERWLLHGAVLELGPEGLTAYRDLHDAAAKDLLDRGLATRDPDLVGRVRREYLPSSVADEAILWLARFEMDRGEFAVAARLLDQLDPESDAAIVGHPDPTVALREVRLRLAVCHAALGDAESLEATRARIGDLPEGPGSEALRAYLAPAIRKGEPLPREPLRLVWALPLVETEGDDPLRTHRRSFQNRILLEIERPDVSPVLLRNRDARPDLPSCRPIVDGDRVYFRAGDRLVGVAAPTAKVLLAGRSSEPLRIVFRQSLGASHRYAEAHSWQSIAAGSEDVFCLEDPAPERPELRPPSVANWIASYSPGSSEPRLEWHPELGPGTRFLGPIVRSGDRLLVPTLIGPDRLSLLAISPRLTVVWSADLGPCRAQNRVERALVPERWAGRLSTPEEASVLTLSNGTAFWAGENGWLTALGVATGELRWVVAYPSSAPGPFREYFDQTWTPSPPVRSGPHLVVAPVDSDSLLCLDAGRGRELWRQPRERQWLLLGALDGLVFTGGEGVVARALDHGGAIEWERADLRVLGFAAFRAGEILIAASGAEGPGIFGLDARTGRTLRFDPAPRAPGHDLALGNLVLAGDLVLSAGPRALLALSPRPKDGAPPPDPGALIARGRWSLESAALGSDPPPRATGDENYLATQIEHLVAASRGLDLPRTLEAFGRFHEDLARLAPKIAPRCRAGLADALAKAEWEEEAWKGFLDDCERALPEAGMSAELARPLRVAPTDLPLSVELRWALARWLDDEGHDREAIPHLKFLCDLEGEPGSPERRIAGEALGRLVDVVANSGG